MATGKITIDVSSLNKVGKELKGLEKQMPGAIASALNRALDHGVTQIAKIVPKVYSIKQSEVKAAIKKNPASKGDISANIVIKGGRLTFVHFPFTPKLPNTKRKVKVKIKNGGKKEVKTNPSAFIAPTGAKSADKVQYNVFVRKGQKRLPITVLRTLSIPQMVENESVQPIISEAMTNKLNERIDHEIKYRLDKAAKNIKG
jgi:hypothetical protein